MSANFVDYVKIYTRSGNGGGGSISFRREAHVAFGGPDGGDGGRGGDVIVRGNKQLWTLLHMRFTRHIIAESGSSGSGGNRFGKDGESAIIEVPLGTLVRDAETGDVIFEITEDGQEKILKKGGRGGKGNAFFKNAVLQTPRFSQDGQEEEEGYCILELKVLADVGLVGFPNAGKSTLLSVVSAAKPEIADYPFTTLKPNLGMVSYRNNRSFVMADIPGIIEDAHQGKGLGLRFLRHIERNSCLLFMVPCDSNDIKKDYEILLNELKQYNPELLDKRRALAITKCDMLDDELMEEMKAEVPTDIPVVFISAVAQQNIDPLKDMLWGLMND